MLASIPLSYYALAGLFNFLSSLALAIFVISKNPTASTNRIFSIFAFGASCWGLFHFLWLRTIDNASLSDFYLRTVMIFVILVPATFTHFILSLLNVRYASKINIVNYSLSFLFGLSAYTSLFARDPSSFLVFPYWLRPGPIFHLHLTHFLLNIFYAHYLMMVFMRTLTGTKRQQVFYIFVGTAIGYTAGILNYSPWYRIPVPPFLNPVVSIYVATVAYAIIRHRLMDIEVVIKKTLVFTGIFAFFFGTFAFLSFLVTDVLQRSATLPVRLAIFAVGAAIAALVGNRLHAFLVNATDRFLFQKKYVYYKLLKENSKQMAFIHSLDELAKQITAFLIKQGRIKNAAIFVQSDDGQHYVLKFPLGYGGRAKRPTITLDQNHPLVELLKQHQGPIQTEELEGKQEADCQEVLRILRMLRAEVAIPSFLRTPSNGDQSALRPRNILILGPKKSDQPYSEEDLDVFFTIAQDSAIAAENARLFDTVLKEREAKVKAEHVAERVWFATTIKHEVKNSLTGYIQGPTNMLRMHHAPDLKKAFDEGDREWFEEIFSKIGNVLRQLSDGAQRILDISETTLGGSEPDDAKSHRNYFKILWDEAKKASGVEKLCGFESAIPDGFVIYGKYHVLMRVFENLIINAYDAMKDQKEKLIKLRCSYQQIEGRQVAYCEFEDHGHGIPKEIQSRIFERGFSTKPKPNDEDLFTSGHGQGLYVCKMNIEKLHGGRVWVESEVGKGTIFKFWVPMEDSGKTE